MLFRNYTPFQPVHFDSRDENRRTFGVLVLRGTFTFADGIRAQLCDYQDPILWQDEYFGDPQASSLKAEGDLAPFKPATDVLVDAIAYAASQRYEALWSVGVTIGDIAKKLVITGERRWERRRGRLKLEDAKPVDSVPIRYELAYGGSYTDAKGDCQRWPENPVGRGFGTVDTLDGASAPQIFSCEADINSLSAGRPIETAGLGPVAPHWAPRCNLVGSFNEMWRRTRFPDLPSDFQFAYYNTGSRGLVFRPFLQGNETVELNNLTPERRTRFALPGLQLATIMRFESGEILPGPVVLDTVQIDAVHMSLHMTWRTVYPTEPAIRVLEVRVKDSHSR